MASSTPPIPARPISPQIRSLLDSLRFRIRAYIWIEGLALLCAVVGALFWGALLLDYGPVLFGASEMPQAARFVVLLGIAAVGCFVIYWWILRRAFVDMSDRSMAILIERQHRDFHDSLLTAVELSESKDLAAAGYSEEMFTHTTDEALAGAYKADPSKVFNWYPLLRNVALAAAVILSIGIFYLANAQAFAISVDRLLFLQDEPWPRSAEILVAGIEVTRPIDAAKPAEGSAAPRTLRLPFENGVVKVAKGSNVKIVVRANASKPAIPDTCTLYYSNDQVSSASANMRAIGSVHEIPAPTDDKGNLLKDEAGNPLPTNVQDYVFDGSPFKGILSDTRFDVLGFASGSGRKAAEEGRSSFGGMWPVSNRVRGYRVVVVDPPAVINWKLYCEYPKYTERAPVELPWRAGLSIPEGTKVTIRATANKPIAAAEIVVTKAPKEEGAKEDLEVFSLADAKAKRTGPTTFEFPVDLARRLLTKDGNREVKVMLTDTDRVASLSADTITLHAIGDDPPKLDLNIPGIGLAITPEALIPAKGTITDDYGVDKVWYELVIVERGGKPFPGDVAPHRFPVDLGEGGALRTPLDLRLHLQAAQAMASPKEPGGSAPPADKPKEGEVPPKPGEEEANKPAGGTSVAAVKPLALLPGDKIKLSIQASDRYAVDGNPQPHIGSSMVLDLQVVTPNELLLMVQGREKDNRSIFEQIVAETRLSRESLFRIREELQGKESREGEEPEDRRPAGAGSGAALPFGGSFVAWQEGAPAPKKPAAGEDPGDEKVDPLVQREQARVLRLLRVQRVVHQSEQALSGVETLALKFEEMAEELQNNRVLEGNHYDRYKLEIAAPLKKIKETHLPELMRRVKELGTKLDDPAAGPTAAIAAETKSDLVLQEMQDVLQKLLQFETYNELVETLRKLISEEDELMEDTKQQYVRRTKEELEKGGP